MITPISYYNKGYANKAPQSNRLKQSNQSVAFASSFNSFYNYKVLSSLSKDFTASCYFRRDPHLPYKEAGTNKILNPSVCQAYASVEMIYAQMLSRNKQLKVLIAGVGDKAEEVYSQLATACYIKGSKDIARFIDLDCVDLQPHSELLSKIEKEGGIFDGPGKPHYAHRSFEYDSKKGRYIVIPEINEYVHSVIKNSEKSKLGTNILDFRANKKYDIISCNNTLLYLMNDNLIIKVLKQFGNDLERNGFLITDQFGDGYGTLLEFNDKFIAAEGLQGLSKLSAGIFAKLY